MPDEEATVLPYPKFLVRKFQILDWFSTSLKGVLYVAKSAQAIKLADLVDRQIFEKFAVEFFDGRSNPRGY